MTWRDLKGTIRKGGPATRGYKVVWHKPYRTWYLHRAVADLLIKEWNPFGWDGLPKGMEVHHMDGQRENCEPWNLLILQDALHHAFQRAALRCPYTGQYLSKEAYNRRFGREEKEEVPF